MRWSPSCKPLPMGSVGRSKNRQVGIAGQRLRATAPPLGQRRADHQLDLMEEHEREDGRANRMRSKDYFRHGDALSETLLRAAEDDCHAVGALEAQPFADEPGVDHGCGE